MIIRFRTIVPMVLMALLCHGQKTNLLSGNWNNGLNWLPLGVPGPGDDVQIANGTTISITSTATCNNLTVGTGGSTGLEFSGAARSFTVGGNLLVNSGATFAAPLSSNSTHTLVIAGNITNNGVFQMFSDNNSRAFVHFVRNGAQAVAGTGSVTNFYRMTVNMGTSATNILDVSATSFSGTTNFLQLQNGTFRLSAPAAGTLVPFTTAASIPSTAGLWINSASASVTTNNGLTVSGEVRVQAGYLQVGIGGNDDLACTSCTVAITGGSFDVAGNFNASSGAGPSFSITGGTFRVPDNSSTDVLISPFHLSAPGSAFVMTGGTILIKREGGGGPDDLGYLNTANSAVVTGGTLEIGEAATIANQTITINSSIPIPNLVVNSANARAKFAAGTHSVTGHVAINSGTLIANNGSLVVGGSWTSSGVFTPGTGTVNFSSAGTQTITRTGGETFGTLVFSGTGLKTLGSDISANATFSIAANASVDVSASSYSVTVRGDYINDGFLNTRAGSVVMGGTSLQQLGGNSVTSFNNLRIANAAGVSLASSQRLLATLLLNSGTFATNNIPFTLVSSASGTGRIGTITGGDISGDITVQRFIPGGSTGWALLGSPIASGLTMTAWDDNLAITCASCPDGYQQQFTSIYSYNETAAGSFDAPGSYLPIASINAALSNGVGYWVYTGNGFPLTSAIVTDVTGPAKKGTFTMPLSYTNHGNADDDGWNLIANPYPSPISWTSLRNGLATVDNAIYVYNADLGGGSGAYATFVNGVSSPGIAAGGIGDEIAMGQGFYVHATAAVNLNVTEAIKTNGSQALLKLVNRPTLRVQLSGGNKKDEAVLYLESGATSHFDLEYDAYEMGNGNAAHPLLAFRVDSLLLQVSGVAPVKGSYTTALLARTGVSGNYTISATELSHFPQRACITLEDLYNHKTTDLTSASYTFFLSDTTSLPRFVLHVTIDTLQVSAAVVQPSCADPSGGVITATASGTGPWNYAWKKNGSTVRTVTNSALPDQLTSLDGGAYSLEVYSSGKCDFSETSFNLQTKVPVVAAFNAEDTLFLPSAATVQFTNSTTGATSYQWFFGAGEGQSGDQHPTHVYTLPGRYTVELFAGNSTGCSDSAAHLIEVIDLASALQGHTIAGHTVRAFPDHHYEISGPTLSEDWLMEVTDASGSMVSKCAGKGGESGRVELEGFSPGLYYVLVKSRDHSTTFKLPR